MNKPNLLCVVWPCLIKITREGRCLPGVGGFTLRRLLGRSLDAIGPACGCVGLASTTPPRASASGTTEGTTLIGAWANKGTGSTSGKFVPSWA